VKSEEVISKNPAHLRERDFWRLKQGSTLLTQSVNISPRALCRHSADVGQKPRSPALLGARRHSPGFFLLKPLLNLPPAAQGLEPVNAATRLLAW